MTTNSFYCYRMKSPLWKPRIHCLCTM